jgi:nitrite reductase/ring-hydroxylating ferredoxin subunit
MQIEIDDTAPACGRRAALLGIGALGVAGLVGCSDAQDAVGSASSAVSSATQAVKDAIATADIPVGGGKVFPDLGVIVTQPTAGSYKVFTNICTHQGTKIDKVADGVMECPLHHSKFSIADGSVVAGPATKALPEKSVKVSGDGITVT